MKSLFSQLHRLGLEPDARHLRHLLQKSVETLMELDVSQQVAAEYYERNQGRVSYRNGYRTRKWKTRFGDITVHIPKLRNGTYTPFSLTSQIESNLIDFILAAYTGSTSIEAAARILALADIPDDSQNLAQFAADIEDSVNRIRQARITQHYPYLLLETLRFEENNRDQNAVLIVGVSAEGKADLLTLEKSAGFDDEELWLRLFRNLVQRGLKNVKVVISDAYRGVKLAVYEELIGAEWQYSQAHFLQKITEYVAEEEQTEVINAISSIFVQSGYSEALKQLERVITTYHTRHPQAMMLLQNSFTDLTSHIHLSTSWVEWQFASDVLARIQHNTGNDVVYAVAQSMIVGDEIVSTSIGQTVESPVGIMAMMVG